MKSITFLYAYFIKKKKSLDLASLVWLKIPKAINKKKTATIYKKNYPFFYKKNNYFAPVYKKLQPQISVFIKNSFFGNDRDSIYEVIPRLR